MKNYLLIILLATTTTNLWAQTTLRNSFKLHTGRFTISDRGSSRWTGLLGASYTRSVCKGISVSLGYSFWRRLMPGSPMRVGERLSRLDTARGTLTERRGYKMLDITPAYSTSVLGRRHLLSLGLGLSYCWGRNAYIETRGYSPIFWYNDTGTQYINDVNYWGLVPQITYDFIFLNNRLNLGLDVRSRHYINIPQSQFEYGAHMGFNF